MNAAIVGLGRMGLRHLQILRELGLPVAGASDQSENAREKAAAQFNLPPDAVFADPNLMLDSLKPELVVVATTAPSHEALVCRAATAGTKAILCEKPMATSVAACDRMIDACLRSGTKLSINHQMRFMEQYVRPKQIVSSESFGGLSSVTVTAGNFGMAMNGSHYFEMFRYLTDEMPSDVSAWFCEDKIANPRGPQFEDRAGSIRLTTRKGRRFYMDASGDQGHGMHVTYAGPYGRLDVDELAGRARLVTRKAEHRAQPTTRYGMSFDEQELTIAPADAVAPTRSVLLALLASEDFPDGEAGRAAVEVLAAAYQSHETGGRRIGVSSPDVRRDRVFPWA